MTAQQTKTRRESLRGRIFLLLILAVLSPATLAIAQTTSFTYQGRFTEGGTPATGTYDMQFKLFDTASAGNQIGATITNGGVVVNNGVFTVQLDYGAAAFSGADRYLEIGVRLAGDANPYTILSPRQQLTSAVYAIRAGSATNADTAGSATTATTATNATQLGGLAANQFVQTNDTRLADARTPTAGSANYIQNTANQQTASNFNISGNGTAGGTLSGNILKATTQFNLGNNRVLSAPGADNLFAGLSAGEVNTTGSSNAFFGALAGSANTSGIANSFFGAGAGQFNKTAQGNSFFGRLAGTNNTGDNNSFFGRASGNHNGGSNNSFFGNQAGNTNGGGENSFFGESSGVFNTSGDNNSFFGANSGDKNTTGSGNSFFGRVAGRYNQTGSNLTFIGYSSGVEAGSPNLINATAIGANASVSQSNSLVLGSINGVNSATADTNVGIGTRSPSARLHIAADGGNIVMGDAGCSSGFIGIGFGSSLSNCGNYSVLGNGTDTIINRPTGGVLAFRENNVAQMSIAPGGAVTVNGSATINGELTVFGTFSGGGDQDLCWNSSNFKIMQCSSSLRYKTNISAFSRGLELLGRLRPITFDWKHGGARDLGFGAEEVAAVEPLLVTHNQKGEVEGVKYDRITAVLVNAVKEQQEQIKQQQSQIQSLKKLVCQRHRRAAICK